MEQETFATTKQKKAPLIEPQATKKKQRGAFSQVLDDTSRVTLVRWYTNSVVRVASNRFGILPMGTAKRWSQDQKKSIEIDQPHLIALYNKHMGGVDLVDQGVADLYAGIRIKKWQWPLFWWLLNVSVHNAWKIYRQMASKQSLKKIGPSSFNEKNRALLLGMCQSADVQKIIA